jgi:hypothetical protein
MGRQQGKPSTMTYSGRHGHEILTAIRNIPTEEDASTTTDYIPYSSSSADTG